MYIHGTSVERAKSIEKDQALITPPNYGDIYAMEDTAAGRAFAVLHAWNEFDKGRPAENRIEGGIALVYFETTVKPRKPNEWIMMPDGQANVIIWGRKKIKIRVHHVEIPTAEQVDAVIHDPRESQTA